MQTQIKNTGQGQYSNWGRKKSELEDIMEMTEAEQNKEEKRTVSETSGTELSTPTFES